MIAINRKMSKLEISKTKPIRKGMTETNMSGTISFHPVTFLQNLEALPLLKSRTLSLPFPKPQVLPQ
jgi:hypothetical protein